MAMCKISSVLSKPASSGSQVWKCWTARVWLPTRTGALLRIMASRALKMTRRWRVKPGLDPVMPMPASFAFCWSRPCVMNLRMRRATLKVARSFRAVSGSVGFDRSRVKDRTRQSVAKGYLKRVSAYWSTSGARLNLLSWTMSSTLTRAVNTRSS